MNRPISEKIQELRKARSMTQAELGEKLGITSQAISKWEKGESLPDIMMLPALCQLLGVSVDALLEMPFEARKQIFTESLGEYAKESGVVNASFDGMYACAKSTDDSMRTGSAHQCYDGISVCTEEGIAFVIKGEKTIQKLLSMDLSEVRAVLDIVGDESTMKVISSLDFSVGTTEVSISSSTGLPVETVENILFKLMKSGLCECNSDGECTFGHRGYALASLLAGIFLCTAKGQREVNSIRKNYPQR